jgi:predicted  nucleic acid-binding Zn-ribbon protein
MDSRDDMDPVAADSRSDTTDGATFIDGGEEPNPDHDAEARARAAARAVSEPPAKAEKTGPDVGAPSTRVTVAFPFSTVKIQEPGEVLIELASLVADLAHVVDRRSETPDTADLAEEADALVERLRKAR